MNATTPNWSLVNIGSGNGLVPSGNKPLPEPMLTQILVAMVSLGPNELKWIQPDILDKNEYNPWKQAIAGTKLAWIKVKLEMSM